MHLLSREAGALQQEGEAIDEQVEELAAPRETSVRERLRPLLQERRHRDRGDDDAAPSRGRHPHERGERGVEDDVRHDVRGLGGQQVRDEVVARPEGVEPRRARDDRDPPGDGEHP